MHPRTQELIDYLGETRATLRGVVDDVPIEARERPPSPGRWSVAGVLEHLGIVETAVTMLLRERTAAARADGIPADDDVSSILATIDPGRTTDRRRRITTAPEMQPAMTMSVDEAWRALDETRRGVLEAVRLTDGLAIGTIVHPHPALGPLTLYEWIAFVGAHELRHAEQIREVARELGAAESS